MTCKGDSKNVGCQAPRVHIAPKASNSLLEDARTAVFAPLGLILDPWQESVLADWLAEAKPFQWASRICGLACPRQNGKNVIVEARELFGVTVLGERILHTAHETKTAKKHWKRLLRYFGNHANDPKAKFPWLNNMVADVRRTNGEEAIVLHNGGSIEMAARTKSSSRGYSVDLVVFDEAQQFSEDALEALRSVNSASPNKQTIYLGTPPGPNAEGDVFRRQRQAALARRKGRTWSEWSVTGHLGVDFDVKDKAWWARVNPAYGRRINKSGIKDELDDLTPAGFARERLGWWGPDNVKKETLFPMGKWGKLVSNGPPDGTRPNSLAVDMSHDRVIAVTACWRVDQGWYVELMLVDQHLSAQAAVDWLSVKSRGRIPVVIDSYSPASAMVPMLQSQRVNVKVTSSGGDMAKACGLFFDELGSGRVWHADQDELTKALKGAKKRPIGDAGGFGVDRRNPDVNIAPLVACILALYGAQTSKRSGRTLERVVSQTRKAGVVG